MNKYTFETVIKKSVGNVISNDSRTVEGSTLEERDAYFAVIHNSGNSEARFSKEYWRLKNEL